MFNPDTILPDMRVQHVWPCISLADAQNCRAQVRNVGQYIWFPPGCRAEAHQAVLEQARGALLGRVAGLPTPALLALLEASFPFVGIPELRGVPLAVRRAAFMLS